MCKITDPSLPNQANLSEHIAPPPPWRPLSPVNQTTRRAFSVGPGEGGGGGASLAITASMGPPAGGGGAKGGVHSHRPRARYICLYIPARWVRQTWLQVWSGQQGVRRPLAAGQGWAFVTSFKIIMRKKTLPRKYKKKNTLTLFHPSLYHQLSVPSGHICPA